MGLHLFSIGRARVEPALTRSMSGEMEFVETGSVGVEYMFRIVPRLSEVDYSDLGLTEPDARRAAR